MDWLPKILSGSIEKGLWICIFYTYYNNDNKNPRVLKKQERNYGITVQKSKHSFLIHDILKCLDKLVLESFPMPLSKCLFLSLVTPNQWGKWSGKCGLKSSFSCTVTYCREDLRWSMFSGLPILWRSVSRHISQMTPLVSWEELSTPSARGAQGGTLATQLGPACEGCGCLSTKSINTLQAAKRCAQNSSTLHS